MAAQQRIPAVDPEMLDEGSRRLLDKWSGGRAPLNIFLTYLQNPKLNQAWAPFAAHVFQKSTLAPRQREIVILRTSWLCRSDYEFIQHLRVARGGLLNEAELVALTAATPAPSWSSEEAALIAAADELHAHCAIADETWARLSETLSEQQMIDLVVTAGAYTINSMATNSFGIALEPGVVREPGLTPSLQ